MLLHFLKILLLLLYVFDLFFHILYLHFLLNQFYIQIFIGGIGSVILGYAEKDTDISVNINMYLFHNFSIFSMNKRILSTVDLPSLEGTS